MGWVITARRDGMQGMFSFLAARCTSISCTRGGGHCWKIPSGALRMPSLLPVTPMKRSALS